MSLIYPLPNRNTINLELPAITLDVNQVTLRPPNKLNSDYQGIVCFEWNYFEHHSVELCVTPETALEITKNTPTTALGSVAYQRYLKSELYKRRPPEASLNLSNPEANELWEDMRQNLFPTVKDAQLTHGQIADVNQIFWHSVSSGSTAENSAFVTLDGNFHQHAEIFRVRYGVSIMTPNIAWGNYGQSYGLTTPTDNQADDLWQSQHDFLQKYRVHLPNVRSETVLMEKACLEKEEN